MRAPGCRKRNVYIFLLDNAVKYSPSGAAIRVILKQKGKNRIFSVENPAGQLPYGSLDVLFERFYRTDASRNSATGGSGIGLSVARALSRATGVRSRRPAGTVCW